MPSPTPNGPPEAELQQEIAVVGIARNCAGTLEAAVQGLAQALPPFRRTRWWVVESDSDDDTAATLARLKAHIADFDYRCLGRLSDQLPERTRRLAFCRNACLDLVRGCDGVQRIAYVLVADLDGMTTRLTREALASCWRRDDWTVCTANAAGPYYDLWALRHPQWCPGDCWREVEFLQQHGVDAERAKMAAVYARMITLAPEGDWLEVESAFGGLGLYRAPALLRSRYEACGADGVPACEHVSLHAAMRAAGARIFINPQLIVTDASQIDHYWPGRSTIAARVDGLALRGVLRLLYGKREAKNIRRLLKSVI
jgi:glycosyltransferase involved in cell wall biosynthesis